MVMRRGATLCLALFVFAGYFKAADFLRFVPVDLTLFFGALTVGFCLFAVGRQRRLPPQTLPLLFVFATLALGFHWPVDLNAYPEQKELRLFSLTALAAFAPLALLQEDEDRLVFVYAVALLGTIMAVGAVVEIAYSGRFSRPSVFNTNPILLGRASGFAAVLLCLLYWAGRLRLLIFGPLVTLVLIAVIVSGSRGPLLAVLVTMAALVPIGVGLDEARSRIVGTALAGGAGMTAFVIYLDSEGVYSARRMVRLLVGEWRGAELSRWSVWRQTADLIADTPLGIGWGRLREYVEVSQDGKMLRYPHNIFIEIAAEAGWLPGVVFVALASVVTVWGFRYAYRTARSRSASCPLTTLVVFGSSTYWLICASFSGDVNDNRPLWAMIAVALAAFADWHTRGPADGSDSGERTDSKAAYTWIQNRVARLVRPPGF